MYLPWFCSLIDLVKVKTSIAARANRTALAAVSTLLLAGISANASSPPYSLFSIRLSSSDGRRFSPFVLDGRAATCLIFISTGCPISNSYAPEISRITDDFEPAKIDTYVILTDDNLTPVKASSYKSEYRLDCPVLCDPKHEMVAAAGAMVTPEALVFDQSGHMIYRGRIDN